MASKVLKARCTHPPWGQPCLQLRPLTDPDPWGSTRLGDATIPISVLSMSVCVSVHSPMGLPSLAFTDVRLKVLVSYWYHSYGAQLLCWRLTFGETARALPTKAEGWPSELRAYNTPIFCRRQKLTRSPAREESTRSRRHRYTRVTNASTILRR